MEREIEPKIAMTVAQASRADDGHERAAPPAERQPDRGIVLLIGLYKLGKALVMLIVGITALRLMHHDVVEVFARWVHRLHLDPENRILEHQVVPLLARLTDARLRLVGCGAMAYVVLYTVQGIGLMAERHWAEWLTVISGLGLVPIELYALCQHPTISKASLLGSNLAIAGYLYWHVRKKGRVLGKYERVGADSRELPEE